MRSTSSSRPLAASTSSATTSASPAPPQAASTMARSSRRRGAKMPGVSMNTSWLAPSMAMPRTGMRVVCTLWLTMRDLGADQRVDQRRLAGVGRADDGDEAAAGLGVGAGRHAVAHRPSAPYAFARQQRRGGGLLGGALARAFAARGLRALDAHLGGEARRVVGALARDLHVLRQVEALALRPLLQRGLGVGRLGRARPRAWRPSARARPRAPSRSPPRGRSRPAGPRRRRPGSSPCRARRCRPPTRSAPATAPRSSARATSRAGAAAHQAIVEAGELAFAGAGIGLAQQLGDREAQHAVAEELEPLVVAALGRGLAHAGMRQRLLEQGAILEM